jgi:hypothetical protein
MIMTSLGRDKATGAVRGMSGMDRILRTGTVA